MYMYMYIYIYIHIENACGDAPPPHVFWHLALEAAAGDLGHVLATFLDLHGRNCGLFIHLVQLGEEGKSEKKKKRSTALARFWLDVSGQRNQNTHTKNNHKKYKKQANMIPKSVKKRHLGSPWAPPGLHKREEAVQTHFGSLFWSILAPFWAPLGTPWASPGRPRRSKSAPRTGKRHEKERPKTRFRKKTISGTIFSRFWLQLAGLEPLKIELSPARRAHFACFDVWLLG